MADRATQVVNFYETTLSGLLASAGTSATVATSPGVNASLGDENTWFYLVIDPDNSGNREVVVVKTSSGTSFSLIQRDLENDYAGSPPDHQSGTTVRMAVLAQHIDDQNDRVATNITSLTTALSNFNTDTTTALANFETDNDAAIATFNSDGATAISNINASSATSMVSNATDGTSIEVDIDNDYMLVYDATDTTSKKVYANQTNKELKGYKETDVALSSSSGVVAIDLNNGNTGSLILTENITAFEFTNVPTNGVSTFTLKITQDATTPYTVAITNIDINAPTLTAQTAKTSGASGFDMTATLSSEDLLFFMFFDAGTPYLTAQQEMS